jgi:hypothetical protein
VTRELKLRERGRVSWGGVVKSGGGSRPFLGAGGREGPSIGRGIREQPAAGIKGGMNSGCKSRLRPGLRRDNGRP